MTPNDQKNVVKSTIHAMYACQDSVMQKKAHEWLLEYQKLPEAWEMGFALLQENDDNLRFFGAHMLQVKIGRDWNTLPEGSREQFKEEIIRNIHRLKQSSNIVKRKLALVLVYLSIKLVPDHWPNFIDSLFTTHLNPSGDVEIESVLLETLRLLPEEANRADLPSDRVAKFHSELVSSSQLVLSFLQASLSSPSVEARRSAAKCVQSWIHLGVPVRVFSDTISATLALLDDPSCYEEAVEILIELIGHKQSIHFEKSLCDGLLGRLTTGTMTQNFEKAYQENDETFLGPYCRLMVAFGETFTSYIVKNFDHPHITGLLDVLLKCTNFPGYYGTDEEISDTVLNFWYNLQETIDDACFPVESSPPLESQMSFDSLKTNDSNSSLEIPGMTHSGSGLDPLSASSVKQKAKGLYLNLTQVLWRKATYPPENELKSWSSETRSRFKTFRRDIADTLISCYYVINNVLFNVFIQGLQDLTLPLEALESAFFCCRSVSEAVDTSTSACSQHLNFLFEFVFTKCNLASVTSLQLKQAVILFLGTYAPWMQSQASSYIMPSVSFLVPFFAEKSRDGTDVAAASFRSFRLICDSCKTHLSTQVDAFVDLFLSPSVDQLTPENRITFAESIGQILQALSPEVQRKPFMKLSEYVCNRLKGFISQNAVPQCLSEISCFAAVFRGMHIIDEDCETGNTIPVDRNAQLTFLSTFSEVLSILWPLIEQLCATIPDLTDDIALQLQNVIEALTSCFNVASGLPVDGRIGNIFIKPDFTKQYLIAVSSLLTRNFERSTKANWIDAASNIVITFGSAAYYSALYDERSFLLKFPFFSSETFLLCNELNQQFSSMFQQFTEFIFRHLDFENGSNLHLFMDNQPDVTESLLILWSNYLKFAPNIVLQNYQRPNGHDSLTDILIFATSGLRVQHSVAFRVCTQFWVNLLSAKDITSSSNSTSSYKDTIEHYITPIGQSLVLVIVQGLLYGTPRSGLSFITDVFIRLLFSFTDKSRLWLKEALHSLQGDRWKHLTPALKESFMRQVFSTRNTKRLKEILKDVSIKSRGLEGTAFGNI